MTLPAFASTDALWARLGVTLEDADLTRAQAALDDVSTLIRTVAGVDWATGTTLDTDLPSIVVVVTLSAAERAYRNPDGLRSEALGSYSATYSGSSLMGVSLTAQEKALIRNAAGGSSVSSIEMEGPFRVERPDLFAPTGPLDDADMMPWVTLGDDGAY